ncbi:hypothetical protein [Chitinophaga sp. S165]|uniref:hypothetical protein n=1 Tax=Chitinophaga sp. S165 TaxID=2135462 RepID=UPI0011B50B45|nr:hypothetical protein [Chitinophaga sp. S165]
MLQKEVTIEKHHFRFGDFWSGDAFNTLKKHLIYSFRTIKDCIGSSPVESRAWSTGHFPALIEPEQEVLI